MQPDGSPSPYREPDPPPIDPPRRRTLGERWRGLHPAAARRHPNGARLRVHQRTLLHGGGWRSVVTAWCAFGILWGLGWVIHLAAQWLP